MSSNSFQTNLPQNANTYYFVVDDAIHQPLDDLGLRFLLLWQFGGFGSHGDVENTSRQHLAKFMMSFRLFNGLV